MSLQRVDRSSLAAVLPWGQLIYEGKIAKVALRGKGMMRGWKMEGLSLEGAAPHEAEAHAQRFSRAIATHLGTNDMLHYIAHRRPAMAYPVREFPSLAARMLDEERARHVAEQNYWQTEHLLFGSTQRETAVREGVKASFFAPRGTTVQRSFEAWDKGTDERWAAFADACSLKLEGLGPEALFRTLIRSASGRDIAAAVPTAGIRLNEIVGTDYWYGGVAPQMGELHMSAATVVGYPARTMPQIMQTVLRHPGQLTLSARFICQDLEDTHAQLQLERTYQVRAGLGSIVDIAAKVLNIPRRATLNQDIERQIAEIDSAIAASAAGMAFGWCTIVILIWDSDPENAKARRRQIIRDLSALGIIARAEDANQVEAAMSTWPGNGWSNVRRPSLSAGNYAEVILPIEYWPGTPFIDSSFYPRNTPVPLVCGGSGREPFYPATHIGQVANQLIIGPTGSGKSAELGATVAATTGLPGVRIFWIDIGYSSFVLAHAMGAEYHELGAEGSSPLCPLAHLDDEDGIGWLFDWFRRLFLRWQIVLDEVQSSDLSEALEQAKGDGLQTMTEFASLLQNARLREVLINYTQDGKWGHIFDGKPETQASPVTLTVYEMAGLRALGERAAAPATELILHGIEAGMGVAPTFIFVDEAWRMLSDEVSAEWLYEAIRTFRRRNAGIILATQSLTEVANSPYRDLLLESCPVKIFLPNPEAKGAYVREAYLKLGLSEHEIAIVANAQPKRQYYFHSSQGRRLFTLDLGPLALALCTATGQQDVAAARELLQVYGSGQFLSAWLHARDLGPAPETTATTDPIAAGDSTFSNGRVFHD